MLVNNLFLFGLGAAFAQASPITSNNAQMVSTTDLNEILSAMFAGSIPAELPSLSAHNMATNVEINPHSRIDVAASINDLSKQAGMIKEKYTQATSDQMADLPKLLDDIQGLIKNVATVLTGLNLDKIGSGNLVKSDQNKVCEALGSFITVVKDLIDGFIGEQGLFAKSILLSPIVFFLRAVENGVESFARGLVDVVPTCKKDLNAQLESLVGYLNQRAQVVCKGGAC